MELIEPSDWLITIAYIVVWGWLQLAPSNSIQHLSTNKQFRNLVSRRYFSMKEKRIWIPDFRLQKCFVFNLSNMKEVENLL